MFLFSSFFFFFFSFFFFFLFPFTKGITQRVSNLKERKKWLHLLSTNNKKFQLWPSGLKSVGPHHRCTFFDGTTLENIDVIVSCTGYQTGIFPFLQETIMAECREEYVVGVSQEEEQAQSSSAPPLTTVRGLNLYRRIMHPVRNFSLFWTILFIVLTDFWHFCF